MATSEEVQAQLWEAAKKFASAWNKCCSRCETEMTQELYTELAKAFNLGNEIGVK